MNSELHEKMQSLRDAYWAFYHAPDQSKEEREARAVLDLAVVELVVEFETQTAGALERLENDPTLEPEG